MTLFQYLQAKRQDVARKEDPSDDFGPQASDVETTETQGSPNRDIVHLSIR